jgi:glycosyltransferase involved in cell wall biosynthesis
MNNISVIIHTRNSGSTLAKLLQSVAWAKDKIVIDMESGDDTLALARQHGCRIFSTPPVPRVDGIRNNYLDRAETEWILVMDSDEYLASDAAGEISRLIDVHERDVDAFAIPRYNKIAGQILQGSKWYPDHQIRLFRRGTVAWADNTHQGPVVLSGTHRLKELAPPGCLHLHHDNYDSLEHFLRKQLDYALQDRYEPNPDAFSFDSYLAQAYQAYAERLDPERDGELSRALAHVMAWDAVLRGLIHWEKLGRTPSLGVGFSLPAYPHEPRKPRAHPVWLWLTRISGLQRLRSRMKKT